MKKQDLVLLIITKVLMPCKNHITRLHAIGKLTDSDKPVMRFLGSNGVYYYLFSVGRIDVKYECSGAEWSLELINKL